MIKRLIKKTVTAAAVAGMLVSCGGNAKKQEDITVLLFHAFPSNSVVNRAHNASCRPRI